MWQGSPQFPVGTVMGDKADLSHRGTAVCQGPYVIKISYIKTNRANFYFLKNILLFGFFFFFLTSSLFCHEQPGMFWPRHGNYPTTSELFCTHGRDVGRAGQSRAGQSSVLNSVLSSNVTSGTCDVQFVHFYCFCVPCCELAITSWLPISQSYYSRFKINIWAPRNSSQ